MNEWFKKFIGTIKEKWASWKLVQKLIAVGIGVAVIVAVVVLIVISSKPSTVYLYNRPVTDEIQRNNIIDRLSLDGVDVYSSADGYISVQNKDIARRYRNILLSEGLVPANMDTYSIIGVDKWARTDFNDKVDWQHASELRVEKQLKDLAYIQRAIVNLSLPEESLFASTQKATTASVTIYSNGTTLEKKQILAIQRLVSKSVEGLSEDNIIIVDGSSSLQINDFEGMADFDSANLVEKQQKIILKLQSEYISQVLANIRSIYGPDRCRVANMKIDMDFSKRSSTKREYSGVVIKPDNPNTPYDDSDIRDNLILSTERIDKKFTGTGFNPEGPSGVEGQNPPVYSDMSNVVGQSIESSVKENNALNETNTTEEIQPTIDRVTVAVNIDGTWRYDYDEKGNRRVAKENIRREDPETHEIYVANSGGLVRIYTPLSQKQLDEAIELVGSAVGYNKSRGDRVTVTNQMIDRTEEHNADDDKYRKQEQTKRTVIFILIGVAVVLIAFILFRIISREIERRRRLREEELLRQQQAAREKALWDAQNEGMEVTMSVEERKRAELQENAVAMAKEHPEDVAMLIRTWLMEE